jgi:uncharacterized membrane protein YdjX (TVP38/TMEM64 family)
MPPTPASPTIDLSDAPAPRPLLVRVLTSPWARLALLAAMIVAALVIAVTNDGFSLEGIRGTIDDLGMAAPLVYVLLYGVVTVLLLPGTPFTVGAGLLFGPVLGSVTALVGATLGATLSFLVGRVIGRSAVEQLAGRRVQAIDDFLSSRGFIAILMVRLIPLFPFNVVNLVSGITALKLRDYVLGTAIGIIPGTVLLAALGGSIDDPTSPLFLGALGGFVALTVVSGLVARRMRARDRAAAGYPREEQRDEA